MTYFLIFSIGLALGWLAGTRPRRVARLVFIAGDLRRPRCRVIDADTADLDDFEELALAFQRQREIGLGHLHNFDDVRRALGERRVA